MASGVKMGNTENGFTFEHGELKPCPFCDEFDLSFNTYLCDGWVECDTCGARGPSNNLVAAFLEKSEDNATIEWNERVTGDE